MSPRSQPPGQGHGSWEWALSQVQHSPLWFKGGKGQRMGHEESEVRVRQAGPGALMRVVVALSSQPEGQGLWHVRGRQFRASALAPSSPGTAALGSAEHSHSVSSGFFISPRTAPEHT